MITKEDFERYEYPPDPPGDVDITVEELNAILGIEPSTKAEEENE